MTREGCLVHEWGMLTAGAWQGQRRGRSVLGLNGKEQDLGERRRTGSACGSTVGAVKKGSLSSMRSSSRGSASVQARRCVVLRRWTTGRTAGASRSDWSSGWSLWRHYPANRGCGPVWRRGGDTSRTLLLPAKLTGQDRVRVSGTCQHRHDSQSLPTRRCRFAAPGDGADGGQHHKPRAANGIDQ